MPRRSVSCTKLTSLPLTFVNIVTNASEDHKDVFHAYDNQNGTAPPDLVDRAIEVAGTAAGAATAGPHAPLVTEAVTEAGRRARQLLTNHDGPLGYAKIVIKNPLSLPVKSCQTFIVQSRNMSYGSDYSVQLTISRVE